MPHPALFWIVLVWTSGRTISNGAGLFNLWRKQRLDQVSPDSISNELTATGFEILMVLFAAGIL